MLLSAISIKIVEILILIITIFPAIVAVILKGKYFKLVLGLALINIAVAVIAQKHNPDATTQYLVISTFNIIFACIIWYLAFKRKAELVFSGNKETARKILSAGGWVIVLGVISIIAAFIYVAASVGLGG
jgi:hypothetical protein